MNTNIKTSHIFLLFLLLLFFSGCTTIVPPPLMGKDKTRIDSESRLQNDYLDKHPELLKIYKTHKIEELPGIAGDKFVHLFILTRKKEYLPKGNRTFCVKFFHDYFNEIGYTELLGKIKNTNGKNMVEKTITFAQETGEIEILLSGYEAQKLANEGRDVGVLGEYYYDKAEKKYTVHYSVVQPSKIAYDEEGNVLPYYITGCITKRKNVNDRYGTGAFLAQAGVANGLIDFRWAYNRKMNGIIQKDNKGNFRGGIIFIVFPKKPVQPDSEPPGYQLSIATEPTGSLVYIDGLERGISPLTIDLLKKDERTLLITHPGYKDKELNITFRDNPRKKITVKLEEIKGSITISTIPDKAEVRMNGKQTGISPLTISDLSCNEYTITIHHPGYVSFSKNISVTSEAEIRLDIALNTYEMITLEGGHFIRENTEKGLASTALKNNEKKQRNDTSSSILIDTFEISKYEVTGEQYEEYCIATGRPWTVPGIIGYRNRPATHIDWYDAIEYCNWLSSKENLPPCYEIIKDSPDTNNLNKNDTKRWVVTCNFEAKGYRLPSEAEWEYAALGGNKSKGYVYAGSDSPEEVAWYNENSDKKIQVVGQKKPNEAGIFDMTGNAWEWCWDWHGNEYQPTGSPDNPAGPEEASALLTNPSGPEKGYFRIRKGGSAFNTIAAQGYLIIRSRNFLDPDESNAYTGIRVVRRSNEE